MRKTRALAALSAALFALSCRTTGGLGDRAAALAREAIIADTHIDVPYRLQSKPDDVSVRTMTGDFDWVRARQGGLDAAFMSIYVPASYEGNGAKAFADKLIDMVEGIERDHPDKFEIARSPEDVRRIARAEKVALPMGMENGAPIEGDLSNLRHFRDRGISYITLAHSKNNHICDSSYAKERQWKGLSPFGRDLVAEMNRLGVMIDVSHVSDDAFWQVASLTKAPLIASHSSARKFTPGWERNMDDDMIRRLAATGGVIQINFGSAFLSAKANEWSEKFYDALRRYRDEHGLGEDSAQAKEFEARYAKENPPYRATVAEVADHIDHVANLVGVDHVGFGSDFDGVGDSLPEGLRDVSEYPNLVRVLLERGYSEADVRKICGENTLRVWSDVRRIAAGAAASGG